MLYTKTNWSICIASSAFQISKIRGLMFVSQSLETKIIEYLLPLIKTVLTYISQKTERAILQNNYIYTHIEISVLLSSFQLQPPWKTEMKIFSKQVYFGIFRWHFPIYYLFYQFCHRICILCHLVMLAFWQKSQSWKARICCCFCCRRETRPCPESSHCTTLVQDLSPST